MRSLLVLALTMSFASPALLAADKPKKGKGKQQAQASVTFSAAEREAARLYFVEAYGHGNCPPGLAKKRNGCLPPGQAKKSYAVGRELPRSVVLGKLPAELSIKIGAPPAGYQYAIVDGDLVKLMVGTLLVVDAIEGLVR